MEYREIGKTQIKASVLGFGAMRLPMDDTGKTPVVKEEQSIEMILRGFELGINIIDTAYPYCHQQSEKVVGKALKAWKEKNREKRIYLSTKFPTWKAEKKSDYRRYLEEQLGTLDIGSIDFYHFHTLNREYFEEKVIKMDLLSEAIKAKEEGTIKHIAFSFHDEPGLMKKIIDTGVFEAVLCQYNILDITNKEAIRYAREKGVGVFIMGPLAGGRIVSLNVSGIKELALRFVFSDPDVSVAFSGMENIDMLDENISIASSNTYDLSGKEKEIIKKLQERREVAELISCNNCGYCLPCPGDVAIPKILRILNYYKLTDLRGNSVWQYNNIPTDSDDMQADACTECGQCEENCPQKLEIIGLLKEAHKTLTDT